MSRQKAHRLRHFPWYVIRYDRHSLQTRILACPLHFEVVVKYTIFKQKDLISAHPELKKTFPCLQRVGADATQPLEVQGRASSGSKEDRDE